MAGWEQDFDFYFTIVDGKPELFMVDLNAAQHVPVASHPLRLEVRVPMKSPRPDGLRDASELEPLGALEDQIVEALAQKVEAIYAGRVVYDRHTYLYLHVPVSHREALGALLELTGAPVGGYDLEWVVTDDPEWTKYVEYLAPDAYAQQEIWNRRLIDQFTQGGDALERSRPVDHLACFPSRAHADRAAAALRAAGFTTDNIDEQGGPKAFRLQFHRVDRLSEGRPDEFVREILDTILPLDGIYDGWGAVHTTIRH